MFIQHQIAAQYHYSACSIYYEASSNALHTMMWHIAKDVAHAVVCMSVRWAKL